MGFVRQAVLLMMVGLAGGCFAEVWADANPWTTSTVTTTGAAPIAHEGRTWSAGVAVGMWLDAFGLGVGVAPTPLQGTVIHDVDGEGGTVTERGIEVRADVDLPTRFMEPWIWPRVTLLAQLMRETVLSTGGVSGWEAPATGYGLFAGYTMTLFNRGAGLTVGPSYSESQTEIPGPGGVTETIAMQTVGFQARLHVTFVPALQFMKYYTPSVIRPSVPVDEYHPASLSRVENPRGCAFNPHCF